jgi:CRP-like cAMP-binding protein
MVNTAAPIQNPLVTKLSLFAPLSEADKQILDALCANPERFDADATVVREDEVPSRGFVLTRGMACRYRNLPDGRRQILTFLPPGDFFDLHVFLLQQSTYSIGTLTRTRLAAIERNTVIDIVANHPRLGAALWWSALQEDAMLHERVVALGRRNAQGRIAYLLCELFWRQRAIGMVGDHAIRLPLTQADLADTLGLTPVHVNRMLQALRRKNFITLQRQRLVLRNVDELQDLAGFDEQYLHLNGAPTEVGHYLDTLEQERPRARVSSLTG